MEIQRVVCYVVQCSLLFIHWITMLKKISYFHCFHLLQNLLLKGALIKNQLHFVLSLGYFQKLIYLKRVSNLIVGELS